MDKNNYKKKSPLEKAFFLLIHPKYWPKAFLISKHLLYKIFIRPIITFCYGLVSYSEDEAIRIITGKKNVNSFYKEHKTILECAKKGEESCPVKMGGAGTLQLLYQLSCFSKAKRIIETGVAYGWSTLAFLLAMKNKENSLLVSTDLPYSKETEDYVGCVIPDKLREKWHLISKPDIEALPEALEIFPEIDMCHYDSDKSYKGRMFAYPLLWKALRPGGIFISDDIGDNLAFRKFAKQVGENR